MPGCPQADQMFRADVVLVEAPRSCQFVQPLTTSARAETFQSDSLNSLYQVNLKDHDIKIGKVLGRGSFAQVWFSVLRNSRNSSSMPPCALTLRTPWQISRIISQHHTIGL